MNPKGMQVDAKSPQKTPAEKFFTDIQGLAKIQGVDDIDEILKKYKDIEDIKALGLFLTEVNCLCSSFLNINNKLLLYKIETYPYFEDTKTGQTIATQPIQYSITIEPFQILVSNIVGIAKSTSETIHEWHKYAMKLKLEYLNLSTSRLSIWTNILTIVLAITLSAFFLVVNDPFNLLKENRELKMKIAEFEKQELRIKEKQLDSSVKSPSVKPVK